MQWSALGSIENALWKRRPFIPIDWWSRFASLIILRAPEEKQLRKIEKLGENIGLSRQEVLATYNPPLNLTHWKSRLTPFSACVMIIVIFAACFMIFVFLALNDPNYWPPEGTYRFGSLYGTIRPQDFDSDISARGINT